MSSPALFGLALGGHAGRDAGRSSALAAEPPGPPRPGPTSRRPGGHAGAIAEAARPVPILRPRPRSHARRSASALPSRQLVLNALLTTVGLALAVRFAFYWFSLARLPRDFGTGFDAGDLLLFAGLTFVVWHRQVMDILGWLICSQVETQEESPPPPRGLRVAFITTFVPGSESLEMLRRTLASMIVADYPHDTWLLDEGNDPGARAMCELLGVKHFSRSVRGLPTRTIGHFRPAGRRSSARRAGTSTARPAFVLRPTRALSRRRARWSGPITSCASGA